MAETAIGVFRNMAAAGAVIRDLESHGFPRDQVSVIASDRRSAEGAAGAAPAIGPVESLHGGVGAGAGAAIGGVAGVIAGLAALAIPGIGPLLASGPIMTALAGLGAGAAAGGVIGGLTGASPSTKPRSTTKRSSRGAS